MLYLAGYILACLASLSGIGILLSSQYRRSVFKPVEKGVSVPPQIRAHALISFSIILPFSTLAFFMLTFAAMKIAQSQGTEGHLPFVVGSLALPTICFLAGYFYFKKVVRS